MISRLSYLLNSLPPRPSPEAIRQIVLSLILGSLCGAAAAALGVPLPWMLGPMIGCAIAAFAGARLKGPAGMRSVAIPVIGVMLGSGFHPGLMDQVASWWGALALLLPFLLCAGGASYVVFHRIGQYDRITAVFCAAPGGLNEMIMMGAEHGGNETRIALAHAIRVVVSISAVALGVALVFGTGSGGTGGSSYVAFSDLLLLEMLALVGCAVLGALIGKRVRLPAPNLFGPMLLSAAIHLSGIVDLPPPTAVVITAQLVIGTTLGCRFVGAKLSETGRDMIVSVLATLTMLAVTALFAGLISVVADTPVTQSILAFSPGGLAEMSLLALALGGDVAYVATLHLARIVLVLMGLPVIRRLAGPRPDAP